MRKYFFGLVILLMSFEVSAAYTRFRAVEVVRNAYASTNVTTSAYVQLDSALDDKVQLMDIFNGCSETLVLATGAAASEVDQKWYIFPGGNNYIDVNFASGARLAIKAVSGNCTTGDLIINMFKY